MGKSKLEYIWMDGYKPTQSLRSKTKIVSGFNGNLEDCPMWSFDGSSTEQAEGHASDCLLRPVALFPDPDRKNGFLVMSEVLNDDNTPHISNLEDRRPASNGDPYKIAHRIITTVKGVEQSVKISA